ncbi:MAG: energy-coupled thiamine transporter ThiT [Erysipelotrichaceae bacterium]|nr:energy-coupled thiamine transporter ThiT [Erysipelotrichaceae bacterium]
MKKKFSTKVLAEIAIFAALAFALDALQGGIFKGIFVNGGSIGFAMLPIFVISYRRGLLPGLLCGLILSLIQMLGGIYIIQGKTLEGAFMQAMGPFIQVMLDYVLAYTVVGFTGAFANKYQNNCNTKSKYTWIIVGCVTGGLLKYLSHFLAGVWFWPGEMWGVGGSLYSLLYNGLYCIPNIIICTALMLIIARVYPQFLSLDINIKDGDDGEKPNEE